MLGQDDDLHLKYSETLNVLEELLSIQGSESPTYGCTNERFENIIKRANYIINNYKYRDGIK